MLTQDILRERRGVCKQFVKIFEAMCAEGGVRCKNIKGFAKGDRYVPGNTWALSYQVTLLSLCCHSGYIFQTYRNIDDVFLYKTLVSKLLKVNANLWIIQFSLRWQVSLPIKTYQYFIEGHSHNKVLSTAKILLMKYSLLSRLWRVLRSPQ